jgi:hypothetical protein
MGVLNKRGVAWRPRKGGGDPERQLAAEFRKYAEAAQSRWPATASVLRKVEAVYLEEARHWDAEEAEE